MPTLQETFNTVYVHLMNQGAKSEIMKTSTDGYRYPSCQYRGPNGLMCAAGVLIPDHKYVSSMEGLSCRAEEITKVLEGEEHDIGLCEALQHCHDSSNVEAWPEGLAKIAEEYHLEVPTLD